MFGLRTALVAGMCVATAGLGLAVGAPAAATPGESTYWNNPSTQAAEWVQKNPGDHRADTISRDIVGQPRATWFNGDSPAQVENKARAVVTSAQADGTVPLVVLYNIPDRDCGLHSAGGAANQAAYLSWVRAVAKGLGSAEVDIIVEPDALGAAATCPLANREDITSTLNQAVHILHQANPQANIYLDAGHSDWVQEEEMASLLRAAGIDRGAAGISTNVSNHGALDVEVAHAQRVLGLLDDPDLGAIIDTSRNGTAVSGTWCDAPDAATGVAPTRHTGVAGIDAFAWVKHPGELDGCDGAAGTFNPERAYQQAVAGAQASAPSLPQTRQETTTGTSPAPAQDSDPVKHAEPRQITEPADASGPVDEADASCEATSEVVSEWPASYRVQITVTAQQDLDSWDVAMATPEGQHMASVWSGTVASREGNHLQVGPAWWNQSIGAGDSVGFGAIVTKPVGGVAEAPQVSCTAPTG